MYSQVPPSAQAVTAYNYIATIAKDYSAIKASNLLFSKCSELASTNVNIILSLAHNLELTFEYDKAMSIIVGYWKKNKALYFGPALGDDSNLSGNSIINGQILADATLIGLNEPQHGLLWKVCSSTVGSSDAKYEYAYIYNIEKANNDNTIDYSTNDYVDVTAIQEDFDSMTMDTLALAMTAVKILYCQGDIPAIPLLIKTIDSMRRLSKKPIHLTNIRNENAYFTCIAYTLSSRVENLSRVVNGFSFDELESSNTKTADFSLTNANLQVLAFSNPFKSSVFAESVSNPVFIVGDSHIIPPSWSLLNINNHPRLVIPKLVTGIKHYHFHNDNVHFYPRLNFFNAIQSLPPGSEVIFCIGEIDCREGILKAVER